MAWIVAGIKEKTKSGRKKENGKLRNLPRFLNLPLLVSDGFCQPDERP